MGRKSCHGNDHCRLNEEFVWAKSRLSNGDSKLKTANPQLMEEKEPSGMEG